MNKKTRNLSGNQKKGQIYPSHEQAYYLQVFKDFTDHRKKTQRKHKYNFQHYEKKDPLKDLLKISAIVHKSLGSHFFRVITEKKAGPETIEESSLAMTRLIILEVTWTLCCFRLVLEGKAGKYLSHQDESSQRFLETTLPYQINKTISHKY